MLTLVCQRLFRAYITLGSQCLPHADTVKKLYLEPLRKGTFYEFTTYPDWRFQNPMSEPDPKRKVERSKTSAAGFAQSNLLRSENVISDTISQLLDHMGGP